MDQGRRKAVRMTVMFGMSVGLGGWAGSSFAKATVDDVSRVKKWMGKPEVAEETKKVSGRRGFLTGGSLGGITYYINS